MFKLPKIDSRGFTLIELLITLTIIAILSAIGLIAYSDFLKTSRDSRRQSDLKLIQSGLEDYHSDQLYYPALSTSDCPDANHTDGLFRNDCPLKFASSVNKVYLNKIPKDPIQSREYYYQVKPDGCSGPTCISYCLYANMEKPNPACADDQSKCTDDSTNCPLPATFDSKPYNFAVTRP